MYGLSLCATSPHPVWVIQPFPSFIPLSPCFLFPIHNQSNVWLLSRRDCEPMTSHLQRLRTGEVYVSMKGATLEVGVSVVCEIVRNSCSPSCKCSCFFPNFSKYLSLDNKFRLQEQRCSISSFKNNSTELSFLKIDITFSLSQKNSWHSS